MGKTLTKEQRKNSKFTKRDADRLRKFSNYAEKEEPKSKPKRKFRKPSDDDED